MKLRPTPLSLSLRYVMKCTEFIALCKRHSMLMFPAYNLQARRAPERGTRAEEIIYSYSRESYPLES